LEKKTLTRQENEMIEIAYSIRKMNIIMGLDLSMTAPLGVMVSVLASSVVDSGF
jgi:hypothetical protein